MAKVRKMEKVKKTLSFDKDLLERMQEEADKKGITLSGYLSFVVSEKMEQMKTVGLLSDIMEQVKINETQAKPEK